MIGVRNRWTSLPNARSDTSSPACTVIMLERMNRCSWIVQEDLCESCAIRIPVPQSEYGLCRLLHYGAVKRSTEPYTQMALTSHICFEYALYVCLKICLHVLWRETCIELRLHLACRFYTKRCRENLISTRICSLQPLLYIKFVQSLWKWLISKMDSKQKQEKVNP